MKCEEHGEVEPVQKMVHWVDYQGAVYGDCCPICGKELTDESDHTAGV